MSYKSPQAGLQKMAKPITACWWVVQPSAWVQQRIIQERTGNRSVHTYKETTH